MNVGRCWECEAEGMEINNHHPVPRSRGGKKTIPLCLDCHAKAHHRNKRMNSSTLTKEGLERAKKRGTKLGNPDWNQSIDSAREARTQKTLDFVKEKEDYIVHLRMQGKSFSAIANQLNKENVSTQRGGRWYPTTVLNITKRPKNES
jgi:hypothetical protein